MIKIENAETMGWGGAIRGMRNAMNSWDKSDSMCGDYLYRGFLQIGKADMKLCKNLIKAGSSDRKFMRMIHVQADVTAPLYWWKEYDTYKVGTTANSCSTMHTLHKRDLTIDDFSHEHLTTTGIELLEETIDLLNDWRDWYIHYDEWNHVITKEITSKKDVWYQMIQLLPSSFNQMRTIDLDYETLFSIYHQRKNHKLDEWREFCKWIETLPYMKEFLGLEETNDSERAN